PPAPTPLLRSAYPINTVRWRRVSTRSGSKILIRWEIRRFRQQVCTRGTRSLSFHPGPFEMFKRSLILIAMLGLAGIPAVAQAGQPANGPLPRGHFDARSGQAPSTRDLLDARSGQAKLDSPLRARAQS